MGEFVLLYPKFCHGKTSLPLRWLRGGVLGGMPRFFGMAYVVVRITMGREEK